VLLPELLLVLLPELLLVLLLLVLLLPSLPSLPSFSLLTSLPEPSRLLLSVLMRVLLHAPLRMLRRGRGQTPLPSKER